MVSLSRAEAMAVCHTCRMRHPCMRFQEYLDFCHNHQGHAVSYLNRDALYDKHRSPLAAWNPRKLIRSAFGEVSAWMLRQAMGELYGVSGYTPNANVKQAFQGAQTMTVTNLHSLASSATAGWQSDAVNNETNLYLDDMFQVSLDFANTAPANSKCVFLFAAHSIDGGTKWTHPATGSEGTITLPDVTTTPLHMRTLGQIPYNTQDQAPPSSAFSMAATNCGVLPGRYAMALINHSGAALAASGNLVKHQGVYATVI